MKHYTSIDQSENLLELGVSPETADFVYYKYNIAKSYHLGLMQPAMYQHGLMEGHIPCWSVGALIDIMPQTIEDKNGVGFGLNVSHGYVEYYNPSMGALYSKHHSTSSETTLDACFEMVCYLIEKGFAK